MLWRLFALFACASLPLQAFSATAQTKPPAELHEALVGQINKLNPLFASNNPVDRDITSLIYEGLTTINQYGEIVPDLAEGWVTSPDGVEYIFRLRQDVLWQDGLPFTAADVAYTLRTIRSADFPGDASLSAFWRTVEIVVLNDYTIRFRLVQPLASFPERLRQGIVPAHALEGASVATLDQHPFNLAPIGTGPYQIESLFSKNGQIAGVSLRVSPNYRLRPEGVDGYALDRIVFRTYPTLEDAIAAYEVGEVNSLGEVPAARLDDIRAYTGLALQTSEAPGVGVVIYNWQRDEVGFMRDPRFHLAMARGTDRAGAVQRSLGGRAIPTDSPILTNSWAFNPNARYPEYDLAEAQRLLGNVSFEPIQPTPEPLAGPTPEASPTPPPSVPIRRDFKIMVLDEPSIAGVAFEIMNQWIALGFGVELDIVDYDTLLERLRVGDFDAALVELSYEPEADPDSFIFWHGSQYPDGQNFGGMNDGFINNVLSAARQDPNPMHRKQYFDQFQEVFTTRAPALVLYHPIFVYAPDARLKGVQLDFISTPSDRFRTIKDWTFAADS